VGVVKAIIDRSSDRSARKTGEIAIEHAPDVNTTQQKLAQCKVYNPAEILVVAARRAEFGTQIIPNKY
jgi:hypothetical protein